MRIKQIIHDTVDSEPVKYPFNEYPCIKLIIQGWPGTRFSINKGGELCCLDKTGYFELDLSNNLGMIFSVSILNEHLNNIVLIDCYLQD